MKRYNVIVFITYLLLTLIILRDYIFNNGLIEYGDTRFHIRLSTQVELYSTTWSEYNGYSFIPRGIQWPIYVFLSILYSSYIAQRFLYIVLLMSIQLSMYFSLLMIYRDIKIHNISLIHLSAFIGGIVYLFNPWVITKIGQWYVLWSYAYTPLIYVILHKNLISLGDWKQTLKLSSYLALLMFVATVYWNYFVLHLIFITLIVILYLLIEISKLRPININKIKNISYHYIIVISSFFTFYFLLEAYWMVPYLTTYRMTKASWEPFYTQHWVYQRSPSLIDSIRLLDPVSKNIYFPWQGVPWIISSMIPPILVFYSIFNLLLNYKKYSLILGFNNNIIKINIILIILIIFLGKGTRPPFGEFYAWILFNSPFSPYTNWMLRVPYRIEVYLPLVYSIFLSLFMIILYVELNGVKDGE